MIPANTPAYGPMRQATRPPIESLNTGPYVARRELLVSIWRATSARSAAVEYTLSNEPGMESTISAMTPTHSGIITRSRRNASLSRVQVPAS